MSLGTLRLAVCALVSATLPCVAADVVSMPAGQTSLELVSVGDAGNPGDSRLMDDGTSGYGSVAESYKIGKFEVTIGQYTQFLNAVAKTDTNGLYNPNMGSN